MNQFRTAEYAKTLYQLCQRLPTKGAIKDQLDRSSLSICLNVAEGSGRRTLKDQTRFYTMALGSLREVQMILDLLDAKNELKAADKVGASLWCLIRSRGSG